MYRIKFLFVCLILIIFFSDFLSAAGARVEGYVEDVQTGEPLFGANVVLAATSMGSATNIEGRYIIQNVPPGNYTMIVSYIGYTPQNLQVVVKDGVNNKFDFKLVPVAVEGESVEITAQAMGQQQAINQQLSSNQIINVVSADKIQELPDANAAESVGRLPGVTVLRSGGEGNAVVIRGLQPKYNKILVDGVQLSSSNPDDRGSDLSTISPNMLDGIQVSKSITADMDADVIGGTVNFSLREAKAGNSGMPLLSALVQGSYNNLSNSLNRFNNYKYVLSAENRYMNNLFGVFAQFDAERKNLTSNELGASYTHAGVSTTDYYTTSLGLYYIPRDRQRYNGALVLDYVLPEGKLKLSNFISSGTTKRQTRYENLDVLNNQHLFQLTSSKSTLNIATSALGYEQQLPIFHVDAKLSHTYAEVKNPGDWTVNFLQVGAGLGQFNNVSAVNPEDIPKAASKNLYEAITNGIVTGNSFSKERAITGQLDLKTNLNFSTDLNADIKFGGKIRYQTRRFENTLFNGGGLQFGDAQYINDLIIDHFDLDVPRYHISLPYFADPNFSYGEFLEGKYNMVGALDYGKLEELVNLIKSHTEDIAAYPGAAQIYGRNNFQSNSFNYSGIERQSAGYVMSVVNIGSMITFIPGVRYQYLNTSYKGVRGIQNRLSYLEYVHYDTTVNQGHGYWLPNFSLRIKPLSWFDIRLSYNKTLSYPDFVSIIPRIDVTNGAIDWNNFNLVPQRSTNYDIYLSFYENTIGLFTIGAFYKQIHDLIYNWQFYQSGTNALPYFPPSLVTPSTSPTGVYAINTYVNNPNRADDYGFEADWQTHFWYLPSPLSGIVFNINYTHIYSEVKYPFTNIKQVNRKTIYVDTTFSNRLLDQPDDIINMSLGFDYGDFSVRVSMLYQTDIFTGVNFWPQLRSHTAAYRRWDLAARQKLPWYNIEVYGNVNNINGAKDVSVIQGGGGVPLSEQQYGLTADFGIRFQF